MKTQIQIKGLKVDTIVGICEWEQYAEQALYFDVKIKLASCKAHFTDSIVDALDYAAIADDVRKLVSGSEFKLLESLLWQIASALFSKYRTIQKLKLSVRKPQAISTADAAKVSVSLHRDDYERALN